MKKLTLFRIFTFLIYKKEMLNKYVLIGNYKRKLLKNLNIKANFNL